MRRSIPFVLVVMAMLRSQYVWAGVVTTTADNGPGSLRQAIASATPGETLTFAVSGLITLTSGELLITTNLTITGPGASQLTVQRSTTAGTPDFRIFDIRSDTSAPVTISGLTVNNGRSDSGGGILNRAGAALRMHDLVITGNAATNAGGGIKNVGTLTLDRAIISGNSAGGGPAGKSGFGGGFDNDADMFVSNSRIDNNLAVGGANADGIGGGINNSATAMLINCTVSGNRAEGSSAGGIGTGGGINNSGTMTNFNCTISGNSVSGGAGSAGGDARGGGIANDFGTVNLDKCTVSGNSATGGTGTAGPGGPSDGGGIANECGTVTLENCTVSGNSATPGAGTPGPGSTASGGLFNICGTTTLNHSTVTANTAAAGSLQPGCAVFNSLGSVELKNTIVAGNRASFDLFSIESDTVASGGFNLIGGTNVLISPGPNDRFNMTGAELKLGPLQDNGGLTFTHALLCGSPAIDAGDNTDAPETDQRGFPRIFTGVIDIGAYEDRNTAPTILCPTPTTLEADASGGLVAAVSVQVADADGDELVVVWSVDGTASQTNLVAAGGPPTMANVSFTTSFGSGSHSVLVRVIDTKQCTTTCSTTILVTAPAQGCTTVLELGAAKVSVTGPAGGILGDVGIGPNGNFAMSGDEFVTGTIRLGPGAKFSNSSHGTVHVARNVDLRAEISAAYAKAASAAKLPCTQSFPKLDGKSVTAIAGVAGVNVICVGDVNLPGKQVTLFGPAGTSFIINVTGKFVLTGGGRGPQIRVAGGVQPKDVLYNIIGAGSDVAFSGGGGGVNCCAAIVDGTLLAPQRKIRLSPGLVNGEIISGRDISIVSGASVRCPASP